jgi:hypothetical protein
MADGRPDFKAMGADERARYLEMATEARAHRAEVRRALKEGRETIAEALDDPECAGMRVRQLLSALPGWGVKTARRWMDANGIDYCRRVRGLGVRQRELVASLGRE